MAAYQTAFRLPDCKKEGKAEESAAKGLYFCRRLGLCESKIFLDGSFSTRCAQSEFYRGKPPDLQAGK